MIFTETELTGAFIIELETKSDARGFFARSFCQREFVTHGLKPSIAQCNVAFNARKGTLRGMHYQTGINQETKVVRCTRGALHDVIIDLRPDSATFKRHVPVILTSENRKMLYVPEGCAHGFQTLEDDTEVFYQMGEFYVPESAWGVRWNDPAFRISWPLPNPILSERDQTWPDFSAGETMGRNSPPGS